MPNAPTLNAEAIMLLLPDEAPKTDGELHPWRPALLGCVLQSHGFRVKEDFHSPEGIGGRRRGIHENIVGLDLA